MRRGHNGARRHGETGRVGWRWHRRRRHWLIWVRWAVRYLRWRARRRRRWRSRWGRRKHWREVVAHAAIVAIGAIGARRKFRPGTAIVAPIAVRVLACIEAHARGRRRRDWGRWRGWQHAAEVARLIADASAAARGNADRHTGWRSIEALLAQSLGYIWARDPVPSRAYDAAGVVGATIKAQPVDGALAACYERPKLGVHALELLLPQDLVGETRVG